MAKTPFDALSGEQSGALDALSGRELPVPAGEVPSTLFTVEQWLQPSKQGGDDVRLAMADIPPRPPLSPDVLGSQMGGHGMALGGMPARPPGTGFKELEAVRSRTEQEQIIKNLPPPKTQMERLQDEIKGKSAAEILETDRLWAMARQFHQERSERQGFAVPFTKSFSDLASWVLGRPLTAEEITKAATGAARHGIGQPRSSIEGGVQVAGDVVKMPGAATPGERVFNALTTDDLNKLTTQRTLMRALGGGADVLPINPDEKK
jgi:hypothetical protein